MSGHIDIITAWSLDDKNRKASTEMDYKDKELYNDIYSELSSAFGKEIAVSIFKMYKGQQITFPMHLYNVKKIREALIEEYDGTNIKELSVKYAYSEKTIRRLLKGTDKQEPDIE